LAIVGDLGAMRLSYYQMKFYLIKYFNMTLATHAVVGAVIAKAVPGSNLLIQFAFGFVSHFLIDAIPHGHYPIVSSRPDSSDPFYVDMPISKKSFADFWKIGLDMAIGAAATYLFLGGSDLTSYLTLAAGAIGGILPDALQFVYWKIRIKPLAVLQEFHLGVMHTKKLLDKNQPLTYLIEGTTIIIFILIASIL
jgi:hypothetical protein